MNKEMSVCVSRQDSPIKTFEDVLTQDFIVGRSGRGDSARVFLPLLSNLFGARFKEVPGYNGSSEMNLAMERGEIDGRCGWSWASIVTRNKSWLDDGKINILLQLALEKHPDLPDVPLVLDLTDDPGERKVIETVFASNLMGRPFFGPPGVPAERLEVLRKAFKTTLQDPDFLAEARKMNVEIQLMTGKELHDMVESLMAIPPEILELTKEMIKKPQRSTAGGQCK
jgi:tripartite-type tricarboxylate transporter receptor subunit TctC